MRMRLVTVCIFTALPVILSAQGGQLSGKVTDVDGKGLFDVIVHIENLRGATVKEVLTERDGSYKAAGLQQGVSYKVTYSREEYAPRVKEIKATALENPVLTRRFASAEYWGTAATMIRRSIESLPPDKQQEAFMNAWKEIRESAISAQGKGLVARNLKSGLSQSVWSGSDAFAAYFRADPAKLSEAEAAFEANSSTVSGLDPMLVEDLKTSRRKYNIISRDLTRRQNDHKLNQQEQQPDKPQGRVSTPSRTNQDAEPAATRTAVDSGIRMDDMKIDSAVKAEAAKKKQ